ncbi:multiple sugar transport system substrate-binding protein [Streptosporangium becharense]|uniref:Multiple sugar transport system substrate-binding protein n=1 Tax=Streptosporangium becharense TaxID=1816182 RepID=A0A7W9ILS1_9ACTN|nr:extracellular solute-binding protein [Streptosporangium becharense]MBB2910352.1 multiple sugar transport system substrate-binding protein [Streptosporangium becharense]MBB5823095.1 multiple sugar transport system substrate-binding protein [Streptosporangium becharense]
MSGLTGGGDAAAGGLLGLTWDHPRGYAPLLRLARLDEAGTHRYGPAVGALRWERQSLEGFEAEPIALLAQRYDLLVVDHPGLGAAVESGCLVAMDELFGADELAGWRARTVGPSFDSYTLDGRTWALPLDAATQVAVARPDLLAGELPQTWEEVAGLARSAPVALCLGGPHAFLTFCAVAVSAGAEPGTRDEEFVPRTTGLAVLDLLAQLAALTDPEVSRRNPIGVLSAMAGDGGPAYCPLVYGYASYHRAREGHRRLTAAGAPVWRPGRRPGSVLGGTGLAVSARVAGPGERDAVRAHLRRLLSEPVQTELFPAEDGQPAALAAWTDDGVNARFGGFYRDTLPTLKAAWIRPRFPGFIGFQAGASAVVRDGLAAGTPHPALLDRLDALWRAARPVTGRR